MKNLKRLVSLLLCVCMLLGMTALAEEAVPAEETTAAPVELAADTLLVTVNGEQLTWADVEPIYTSLSSQYASYYDFSTAEVVDFFRAAALESAIVEALLLQKSVEFGLSELTEEEKASLEALALSDWESGIQSYLEYMYPEGTEEELAAAREEAIAYYNENGYSPESLKLRYERYTVMEKVQNLLLQDVTVTDEEVEALYQSLVENDKALYENDIAAYVDYNNQVDMMAYYAMMYGSVSEMDYAWYRPAGFRAVKHILLPVDETLMATYTDLQARYDEQQSDAAAAEEAAEATAEEAAEEAAEPAEPVTPEMINEAKAAVLASLADKIDEINQKIAEGVDFDELIATYGVDADGNPSDPGMANEPTKTTGYEVSAASSNYVPEFVEASMSIAEVGGVSAPYLSDYGIHIVKYIADIPAGPIEMTDAQREAKRASLLSTKQNEQYTAAVESWINESVIEYTGVFADVNSLQ